MNLFKLIIAACFLGSIATGFSQEAALRAGDKIMLDIVGVPAAERENLQQQYTISDGGTIRLHLIGEINAEGEKPSSLARAIERSYVNQQYYTNPTIIINADAGDTQRIVTVSGGVSRSGAVEYRDGMTLLDAIAMAGGLGQFAKPREIRVIRDRDTREFNYEAIVKNPQSDVTLQPGDTIVVPEAGKRF